MNVRMTAARLPAILPPTACTESWYRSEVPIAVAMRIPTVPATRNFHQYLAKPIKKVAVVRL